MAAERPARLFPFHSVAAVRPSVLTLVSPFPFLLVTLTDAMRSTDVLALYIPVSRATGSLIRMFPFPSHVTLTVLVCVMATRLDSSLSCLRFLAYASYSSPVMSTHLSPGLRYARMFTGQLVSLPSRFSLRPVLYLTSYLLFHLPDWTLFLSLTFMAFTPLCTCIS